MPAPSLDGRTFRDVTPEHAGDVGGDTVFEYHEEPDGAVWARYSGGQVRLGHLVGSRSGDQLDFRYAHLTRAGETATGHCTSRIEALADGRLRMHETWEWESRLGTGTSVVEESTPHRRPVSEHAVLDVRPGQSETFEQTFTRARHLIAASPGFRGLRLGRCVESPGRYLLIVEWDRVEDHTEGFRGSDRYEEWRRLLHPFYDPFPTVDHYETVVEMGDERSTREADLD